VNCAGGQQEREQKGINPYGEGNQHAQTDGHRRMSKILKNGYCTISFNSKMHVTFNFSDKSPKSAKIEKKLLQGFSEIGCDT
jgi:hypothetical protein